MKIFILVILTFAVLILTLTLIRININKETVMYIYDEDCITLVSETNLGKGQFSATWWTTIGSGDNRVVKLGFWQDKTVSVIPREYCIFLIEGERNDENTSD